MSLMEVLELVESSSSVVVFPGSELDMSGDDVLRDYPGYEVDYSGDDVLDGYPGSELDYSSDDVLNGYPGYVV